MKSLTELGTEFRFLVCI